MQLGDNMYQHLNAKQNLIYLKQWLFVLEETLHQSSGLQPSVTTATLNIPHFILNVTDIVKARGRCDRYYEQSQPYDSRGFF